MCACCAGEAAATFHHRACQAVPAGAGGHHRKGARTEEVIMLCSDYCYTDEYSFVPLCLPGYSACRKVAVVLLHRCCCGEQPLWAREACLLAHRQVCAQHSNNRPMSTIMPSLLLSSFWVDWSLFRHPHELGSDVGAERHQRGSGRQVGVVPDAHPRQVHAMDVVWRAFLLQPPGDVGHHRHVQQDLGSAQVLLRQRCTSMEACSIRGHVSAHRSGAPPHLVHLAAQQREQHGDAALRNELVLACFMKAHDPACNTQFLQNSASN